MSYFRPSFKVDRTQRPAIRTSYGLQKRSDRGQVLLQPADQNSLFYKTEHIHRPDSSVLETILAKKASPRSNLNLNQNHTKHHTKHIVSFKPGGTLHNTWTRWPREEKKWSHCVTQEIHLGFPTHERSMNITYFPNIAVRLKHHRCNCIWPNWSLHWAKCITRHCVPSPTRAVMTILKTIAGILY